MYATAGGKGIYVMVVVISPWTDMTDDTLPPLPKYSTRKKISGGGPQSDLSPQELYGLCMA